MPATAPLAPGSSAAFGSAALPENEIWAGSSKIAGNGATAGEPFSAAGSCGKVAEAVGAHLAIPDLVKRGSAGEGYGAAHRRDSSSVDRREFGTPVDGSPAACFPGCLDALGQATAASPPRRRRTAFQQFYATSAQPRLGDTAVFVDEEFQQHATPVPASARPAPELSVACASMPASSSLAAVPGSGCAGEQADAPPQWPISPEASMDVDKENAPPVCARGEGMLWRPTSGRLPPEDASFCVLREIVAMEDDDRPSTDDSAGSESSSDFESENLAERLAERVRQNADDRYMFEIYVDPPMIRSGGEA